MPDTALDPLISDALAAWQHERQADGRDKPGERMTYKIREKVTLAKFDHTPAAGEDLAPLEVIEITKTDRTVTTVSPQE